MRILPRKNKRTGALLVLATMLTLGSLSRAQTLVAPTDLVSGGSQLEVPLFKSRVLQLDTPAARVSVGSPDIADILILRSTQLYVLGQDLGTTNVLLWDEEDRLIGTVNIEVTHDLGSLKEKLFELLPNEPIEVYATQRSIVLAGEVSSVVSMNAALQIADTYLAQIATAVEAQQFEQQSQSGGGNQVAGEIINLMQVGGVQQVMLEIKIAEINRNELRRLDAQFNSFHLGGEWNYGGVNGGATFPDINFPGTPRDTLGPFFEAGSSVPQFVPVPGTGSPGGLVPVFGSDAPWGPAIDGFVPNDMSIVNQGLFGSFLSDDSILNLALDVAKNNGLSKVLAEPTVTTLTGTQAYFNSGGQVAVRTTNGLGDVDTVFKDFGVAVNFVPVVLGSGLINLTIEAEVSELVDPVLLTFSRRIVSSTVELREGQTMALAGLIDENIISSIEKFPGLGAIPIIGALFRSQNFLSRETELVIMATPHLAKAIAPDNIRLPPDGFVAPNDAEFYLLGKLEGGASGAGSTASGSSASAAASEGTFGHQLD